jgi:hypothetical protein
MNLLAKAVLAFLAFHTIVMGVSQLFDQLALMLGQGPNDKDAQAVGAILWELWCLTLAMEALVMSYPSRVAWEQGQPESYVFILAVKLNILIYFYTFNTHKDHK